MRVPSVGFLLFLIAVTAASATAPRHLSTVKGPPKHGFILVQSELDLLPAAKRRITLQVDKAQPAAVLEALRKESGLTIEVQGTLPARPMLSGSFRNAHAKELLDWFARQLWVTFRAEPPNTLWIIADPPKTGPHTKEAS
jgi:hypothetical protein